MHDQRLSVALCTYNGERHLRELLDSIVCQVRLPDELVICDDRSADRTVAIIEGFAAAAPFPVHLHVNPVNIGSTKNFEQAIRLCRGDLIALADQDDVWLPGKLRLSEEALLARPDAGAVFTNAEVVDGQLQPLGYTLWEAVGFDRKQRALFWRGAALEALLRRQVVTGATLVFRARLRDLVLPIPDYVVQDGWVALLVSAVADVLFLDEPLVRYRQHGANQIGVEKTPLWRRMSSSYQMQHLELLRVGLAWYAQARERLAGSSYPLRGKNVLDALKQKGHHLRVRAELPQQRWRRILPVLQEWCSGRYSQFSNGVYSVVADLLLPRPKGQAALTCCRGKAS